MNPVDSLVSYLITLTGATLGQTFFIGNAPSSNRVADSIWWIVENGGTVEQKNITGEQTKSYSYNLYYRSRNYEDVKNSLYALEQDLNCDECTQLSGFDTVEMQASTFAIDNDLDGEDRKLGLLQISILIYEEC